MVKAETVGRRGHEEREAQDTDTAMDAVLLDGGRAGRRHGRRDGRPDGHTAVDGVRRAGRAAAATRPVRLVRGRVRLRVVRQLQGRAHGAHGHRVAVDRQHVARPRARVRHAPVLPHRRHTAGRGRVRPGHNHRLRVRPRVVRVHVRRRRAHRRVPGQRPARHPGRRRVQPLGNAALAVPRHRQHQPRRHGHRRGLRRAPVGPEAGRRGPHRPRGPGATQPRREVHQQVSVVRRVREKLHNRHRLYGFELRLHRLQRRRRRVDGITVQDHRQHSGRPPGFRRTPVLHTERQRDRRLFRHGVRHEVQRDRVAVDRFARKHIHLQDVRRRQDGGRDTRNISHRSVQYWKFVRARFPRVRLVQQERCKQRQRGENSPGRTVHVHISDRVPHGFDTIFLLHTENLSGSGHHSGSGVHGRSESRQTNIPFEEERSNPGIVHVFRLPFYAPGNRCSVRHWIKPNIDSVSRGQTQNIHSRM